MNTHFAKQILCKKVENKIDTLKSQGGWRHDEILELIGRDSIDILLAIGDEVFGEGYQLSLSGYCMDKGIKAKPAKAW